jgi:hypothetical protein
VPTPPAPADQPAPPGEPAPLPPPVLGKTVTVQAVEGVVRVSLPRGSTRTLGFDTLKGARQIPVGSEVDTSRGRIRMVTAGRNGSTQAADFYEGRFKIIQRARYGGLTELVLTGKLPRCRATATASKKRKRKQRRLWGDGKGRFTTRGRRSAATVRGTRWLVEDTCAGTRTKVARGTVTVKDFVRNRKVTVRAGRSYLARNPRR